jgi:hypothetical protein
MNDVHSPEQGNLVFDYMHKPAAEEIKQQARYQNGSQGPGVDPVRKAKTAGPGPVSDQDDQNGEQRVDNQVYACEAKVDHGVPGLGLFISHLDQWNGAFDYPKEEHATHQEAETEHGAIFKPVEELNDRVHMRKL